MKRSIKRNLSLLFAAMMLVFSVVPAWAAQPEEDTLVPLYEEYISTSVGGNLSSDLTLSATAGYDVLDTQVSRVDVTIYVEKRVSLFSWERVPNGQPKDQWVVICYGPSRTLSRSVQVDSTGTYRVRASFDIYSGASYLDTVTRSYTIS